MSTRNGFASFSRQAELFTVNALWINICSELDATSASTVESTERKGNVKTSVASLAI